MRKCPGNLKNKGADERIRTADLLITNELLYQLSYVGLLRARIIPQARVSFSCCLLLDQVSDFHRASLDQFYPIAVGIHHKCYPIIVAAYGHGFRRERDFDTLLFEL